MHICAPMYFHMYIIHFGHEKFTLAFPQDSLFVPHFLFICPLFWLGDHGISMFSSSLQFYNKNNCRIACSHCYKNQTN